jgi:hypothetical protein
MESIGSLPIRENSRILLVKLEDFIVGASIVDETVCIILLLTEFWAA